MSDQQIATLLLHTSLRRGFTPARAMALVRMLYPTAIAVNRI